jgi:dihydrolipoamide dehydrogenase
LISGGDDDRLVGAHVIGPYATDLIAVANTAINLGASAEEFVDIIQAHPTLSEVWLEAAHGLYEGTIHF